MAEQHALILAGGRSRRFGSDKTALTRNGRLVLADVVAMLQGLLYAVTILGPDTPHLATLPCRILPDETKYDGALPAIVHAFDALQCDRALVMAADMPFLQPGVVRLMWQYVAPCDLVVLEGGIFPAIYSRSALPTMRDFMVSGGRRLRDLHARLAPRTHTLPESCWRIPDPDGMSLRNINTPEDWR